MLTVTSLYIALTALWLVVLSIYVIRNRKKHKVSMGTASVPELERAVRAQGNVAEYGPMVLLAMAAAEALAAPALLLHGAGIVFLIGRFLHAFSLLQYEQKTGSIRFRVMGMASCFFVLGGLAIWILTHHIM